MPELPEVETIVRSLRTGTRHDGMHVVGQEICGVQVLWPGTLENILPDDLEKRVIGQQIKAVHRRGKFLVFTLSDDSLLMHLRMSGDLRVERSTGEDGTPLPVHKHDRLILEFNSGQRMAFNNPRKFGRVWLVKDPQEILGVLGPEPMDSVLTEEVFYQMLQNHQRQLKPLLMDQHFLAGMGNIYTDEALFRAGLHPLKRSHTVSIVQSRKLLKEIRGVLTAGIERNGASIDWVYRGGDFQNDFNVYGRKGDTCPVCGSVIERIVVGQRGTHICPVCQKL